MSHLHIAKAKVLHGGILCVWVCRWVGAGASVHRACVIRGQPWVLVLWCLLPLVWHSVSHWLGFHHVSWPVSFHGSSCLCLSITMIGCAPMHQVFHMGSRDPTSDLHTWQHFTNQLSYLSRPWWYISTEPVTINFVIYNAYYCIMIMIL